jgi:hypothetical protein
VRRHAKASSAGTTTRLTGGFRLAVLAVTALFAFGAASASAAESEEFVTNYASVGPDGTESSDFESIGGVSVDRQTGVVYVLDGEAGVLYKFEADGTPLPFTGSAPYISGNKVTGLAPNAEPNVSQVTVNSSTHIIYVTEKHSIRAFQADGEPAEFSAGPGEGTSEIPGFSKLVGVSVDSSGNLYGSDYSGTVEIYSSAGAFLTSFAGTGVAPGNLAVAPTGAVYVADTEAIEGRVRRFTPSEFPVTSATTYTNDEALERPSGVFQEGVDVDPTNGDIYVLETNFGSGWVRKFDKDGNHLRFFSRDEEQLENRPQGIAVVGGGEAFQFYVGDNGFEHSKVAIFGEEIIEGPPAIAGLPSAIGVTADSAALRATVNPNTAETTYRFEYGTEPCSLGGCTSAPTTGGTLPAGHRAVPLTQKVFGLSPATTYYYRVVAENSFGTTEGSERTFTTQAFGLGFDLIDARAWEMVTPPDKHGGEILREVAQAAEDGSGIAFFSRGSIESNPDGNRLIEASSALARRSSEGWRVKDITPPNDQAAPLPVGHGHEYKVFAADLTTALLQPRSITPLSIEASERTPYLRENSEPTVYTPLLTGKEGYANVPPGTEFGGDKDGALSRIDLAGASADLKHIGLVANGVALTPGAPEVGGHLYEWSEGQLHPVSVLPTAEGGQFIGTNVLGSGEGTVRHAISMDGSRVFWGSGTYLSVLLNGLTALYLRDTEAEESVRLDTVQPGASGNGEARPLFQGASPDGTVVLFTDTQQLTEDASPAGADLYRCEIPAGSPPAGCTTLTNLSALPENSGESAEVQGLLAGLNEDASSAYFIARGVLDMEPNGFGESALAGQPNLYHWQEAEGVRFVATLAPQDSPDWGHPAGLQSAAERNISAGASPNGRYLAFMSARSLTGQDNLDAENSKPTEAVYRYDAATDQLACVSCNPTGAAPSGRVAEESVDPNRTWDEHLVAATLAEPWTIGVSGPSLYRGKTVLDNGRVLFNSIDSLVPADSNGQWDVYQFEPTSIGGCTPSAADSGTSQAPGGCLSLISSGTAEEDAALLDASASGNDVFFVTSAKLSVTDEDEEFDVYDARVDGATATLTPRTECLGEACQAAPEAPNDPTPASSAFSGAGNVARQCPAGKRRVTRNGSSRCTARNRKKHRQRHRKASHSRRATK